MSDNTNRVLDIAALAAAVALRARQREITMKDVARETGMTPSSMTRLAQGQKPDADGLVTLLAWLNTDAAAFTVPRGRPRLQSGEREEQE
jgi:transcriptional regulator with XRE-family HTH domain